MECKTNVFIIFLISNEYNYLLCVCVYCVTSKAFLTAQHFVMMHEIRLKIESRTELELK